MSWHASTITCGGSSVVVQNGTGCEVEDWQNGLTHFTCANSQVTPVYIWSSASSSFIPLTTVPVRAAQCVRFFQTGTQLYFVAAASEAATGATSSQSPVMKWNGATLAPAFTADTDFPPVVQVFQIGKRVGLAFPGYYNNVAGSYGSTVRIFR